jgi:hypothetical protein
MPEEIEHRPDGVYVRYSTDIPWRKDEHLTQVRDAFTKASLEGRITTPEAFVKEREGKTFWTVELCDYIPRSCLVEVEAPTLKEALKKAMEEGGDGAHWEDADPSPHWVAGFAQGKFESDLAFARASESNRVPFEFMQAAIAGSRPIIAIEVSGGVVQDVKCDGAAIVNIVDHDNSEDGNGPFNTASATVYEFPEETIDG